MYSVYTYNGFCSQSIHSIAGASLMDTSGRFLEQEINCSMETSDTSRKDM